MFAYACHSTKPRQASGSDANRSGDQGAHHGHCPTYSAGTSELFSWFGTARAHFEFAGHGSVCVRNDLEADWERERTGADGTKRGDLVGATSQSKPTGYVSALNQFTGGVISASAPGYPAPNGKTLVSTRTIFAAGD